MNVQLKTATCRFCGEKIYHLTGRIWTKDREQYCMMDPVHGSRLHEPVVTFRNINLTKESS